MASYEPPAVENVGNTPATYHVMQWFSPGMKKEASLPSPAASLSPGQSSLDGGLWPAYRIRSAGSPKRW